MARLGGLVKDTAIYGLSSIIGKFLNWCLVPFYTYTLKSSGEYGVVTELYNWTALAIVVLTYGMETGFFRFVNKTEEKPLQVYSTALMSLGISSSLFVLLSMLFLPQIAGALGYGQHPEFVGMLIGIVAVDAFCAIPFAYLRYRNQAWTFAGIKLLMIATNILFNLFFLWLCPKLYLQHPALVSWFYSPDYGVGYVFLANVFSTAISLLALLPSFVRVKVDFNPQLLKRMLRYSLPLLVLGIAGIMNQSFDKIIFKHLFDNQEMAQSQLGIYGACYKIAIIMMMFTQAFRYAYEPFIFSKHKDKNSLQAYSDAMKYYIIFALFIFLAVMCYMDVLKHIISSRYHEGLVVVPVVLACYLFQGVYFNLSLWYKLTDKTQWGAYLSLMGCVLTIVGNLLFVPRYGYLAAAWTSFVCYFLMMILCWILGQKHYPIRYDLKSAGFYLLLFLVLYAAIQCFVPASLWLRLAFRSLLLMVFAAVFYKRDVIHK